MNEELRVEDGTRYRLLALDLDGTVLGPDFHVAAELVEAIAAFQSAGGHVTVATGRTFRTAVPFAEELGADAALICYQGALIRDHRTGTTLFHHPIPGDLAAEAAALLLDGGIYTQAYVDDELVVPYEGKETEYYRSFSPIHLPTTVAPDLPAFLRDHPPTKLLFIAAAQDVGRHVAGLQEHFVERLSIVRSYAHFGELTAPGSTKGRALATLAGQLGIEQAAVAAAGDQGNDIDMVAWAGWGMAVRSGPPELHAVADAIIGTPDEGGLVEGIRRYLLT